MGLNVAVRTGGHRAIFHILHVAALSYDSLEIGYWEAAGLNTC